MNLKKLEPLKGLFMDLGKDVNGKNNFVPWLAYDADEVDKAIRQRDEKIKELEEENARLKNERTGI